jgi:transglutaminase-like putative cysteine protease
MSMKVALTHITSYQYSQDAHLGPQLVKLRPAPHCRTPILEYHLDIEPKSHLINWQQDPFSNHIARLVFPNKTDRLIIKVDLVAELIPINPFDFFLDSSAEHHPFTYEQKLFDGLQPYLKQTESGPLFEAFVKKIPPEKRRTIEFIVYVNQLVFNQVNYLIRHEPGVQSIEETLSKGSGSCRDSTWLLVQLFRRLGLAARFVSGYLIETKPEWHNLNSPSDSQENIAELHAWCEVFVPGAGWIGLDPTSGLLATEGHIPLACAPEPESAMPINGELDMCEVQLSHQISTRRI